MISTNSTPNLLDDMEPKARRELVEREIKDQASEEETRMLRLDDNLAAWRAELVGLNRSLETQLSSRKKRLAERERLYQSFPDNPDIADAYLSEEEDYAEWKPVVGKLKETVEARLSENKALRQKRQESQHRQAPSAARRDALLKARELLTNEEAIVYRFWPDRDAVLDEIDRVLGNDALGNDADASKEGDTAHG